MRDWISLLLSGSADSLLTVDGTEQIPPGQRLVLCSNSHQSNFIAPYDFFIANRQLIRQKWATSEKPFAKDGTHCWVFQFAGSGHPRIVSICVSETDVITGQLAQPSVPDPALSEAAPDKEPPVSPGPLPFSPDVGVQAAVSGLPIVFNGSSVSHATVRGRRPGRALQPNEVLWDPGNTTAAFSAVGLLHGSVCLAAVTLPLSVHDFAAALVALGMEEALLLGGSGDVCLWAAGEPGPGWEEGACGGCMLAAKPRAASTRATLRRGERPLNAVLAAFAGGGPASESAG